MEKILRIWLAQLCQSFPGSRRAVLLSGPLDEGPYNRALVWPQEQTDTSPLNRVIQASLRSKQTVIKTRSNITEETGDPLDALACPLFLNGQLLGVVAIEMSSRSKPMQQAAVNQVQIGAKWLESMILLQGETAKEQLINLVDLVATGLEHGQFKVAAIEVTNELAERFACQRVSLGFLSAGRIRVAAMSHSSSIEQNSKLVRAIRNAMSEALDQGATLVFAKDSEPSILATRLHSQLATLLQGATICTLPLISNGKAVGVLLLERAADENFSAETVAQCEQIGLLLGPLLEMRRRDEKPLFIKIFSSLHLWLGKLFGPRHLPLKVGFVLSVVVVGWLSLASATFRISCDSVLEAKVCRAIIAPQQGYIATAQARAGDLVRKGDLLATLDDQDLLSEQRKWLSQRAQLLKEYRKALAAADRAEVSILKAKREQAEAQLNLVEQQLDRTRLVAPFAGLIVKGDLSQALGSPIERGEVLFEVAPTNEYRTILKIDDRDIGFISVGQTGQLRLSGIPDQLIDIQVDRITPVSTVEAGRNYFRVEAVMANHSDLLHPGMEGITKIDVGQEKLLWIWSRRLVEWLQLAIWKRIP